MADAYQQIIDGYNAQKKAQEDFLKQQQANQARQLQNQVNQTIGRLEQSKKEYGQTYDDNARQAYIQKMQAQRDLPQRLVAQGISGGLSESGNIALNAAYGNQLSGYKRDYDSQIGAVDQNISSARQNYDSSLASLNNTYLGKLSENNSYYNQLIAQQQSARIQAQEQERLAQIQAQAELEKARLDAEARVRAAQASAQQQAVQRQAVQQQKEEAARVKRLQSHIDNMGRLNGTNTLINYLNAQNTREILKDEDVYWLANRFGISSDQYNARLADIAANAKPDYMTLGEWQAYLLGN